MIVKFVNTDAGNGTVDIDFFTYLWNSSSELV